MGFEGRGGERRRGNNNDMMEVIVPCIIDIMSANEGATKNGINTYMIERF
jgi:hypothetical protein